MRSTEAAQLVNSFLQSDGELVTISRITDATTSPPTVTAVDCLAFVRDYRPEELGQGIAQGDSNVTIGGQALANLVQPGNIDIGLPRKGDKILIRGRQRN